MGCSNSTPSERKKPTNDSKSRQTAVPPTPSPAVAKKEEKSDKREVIEEGGEVDIRNDAIEEVERHVREDDDDDDIQSTEGSLKRVTEPSDDELLPTSAPRYSPTAFIPDDPSLGMPRDKEVCVYCILC